MRLSVRRGRSPWRRRGERRFSRLLGTHLLAEEPALGQLTAHLDQYGELCGGLDAFGDHPQSERVADLDHGPQDRLVGRVIRSGAHQRAVELEDVRGQ